MSYSTMKTLSSIRSLIDEWSIRKEGGKQSFFVLKEIDKLLADTPIDDVVSSNDVADKKNEVRMLHLRIAKHKACERLREIERKSLTDADEISEHIINKNLRRIRIKQQKTIDGLNETIRDLRMAASDMLDTINECARGEAEDSRVLMQVVEIVKKDDLCLTTIKQLTDLLVDYLDAPEGPVVTLKTPSIGTRVVSKNEETHIIDKAKMKAVRMLVGSDMWVLHTGEAAVEDKQQKETIDELTETIKGLRSRMAGARIIIDNQATSIEGLTKDLGARNTVIKDFKAIETKETDRLHKTIEEKNTVLQAYRDENTEVWSKLEKIEKIAEHPAYDCFSTALDEITKIIQEE